MTRLQVYLLSRRSAAFDIVDRATAQIRVKAADHRRCRAEIVDEHTIDRLPFDDSPEGERLRRDELDSDRGVSRALDRLIELGRSEHPARNGCDDCAASEEPNATNEPNAIDANATNEANANYEIATNEANAIDEANATNEANAIYEIATNEPIAVAEANATNEANAIDESHVTNEANAVAEANATNEANAVDEVSVTNEANTVDKSNPTNEANSIDEIVTNEAKLTAQAQTRRGASHTAFPRWTVGTSPKNARIARRRRRGRVSCGR